jgi:hypothetical protein
MDKFQRTTIVMLLFLLQFHTYNKKELVTHHPVVTIGENKKKIEAASTQPWVVAAAVPWWVLGAWAARVASRWWHV